MKIAKRYNSVILGNFRKILIEHVKSNIKDYLILSITFIIGVMVGVIIINNSDEASKQQIKGYINGLVDLVKTEGYSVDKVKLLKTSIFENFKIIIAVWLAGSTIIGIPLIYVITAYKGFGIGYTISAIILSLGMRKAEHYFL